MVIKIRSLVVGGVIATAGFCAGTLYGFNEGVRNLSMLEQVAQGALARHQLAAIQGGQIDSVKHLFELNIDTGVHRYAMFQQQGNELLSEVFFPEYLVELENYVDLMAEYRKDHPMVYNSDWAKPFEDDAEATRLWREQQYLESQKMLSQIQAVLRDHGVPESALTNQASGR
jgi:hypothetical protein